MNAKDFTEFHFLIKQFESEMFLNEICMEDRVDYRGYISWRRRNGFSRSRKSTITAGMIEVECSILPSVPSSARTVNVQMELELENGLILDRRDMVAVRLLSFDSF